ncbi:hypothetical protein P171DRAFT_481581 [Karstenula rhodostoma CBS 690.94]|uniref:Uncharacterized protein n=1 Tax=Karstenula rhodostoma CBS 690.94 TaxID=1392251 RepID=A0A9P4PQV3_9PLEO|nr:hypothetical protein P171DRAFT_481581 [Karstenula rhodostoma CBS 690.94]
MTWPTPLVRELARAALLRHADRWGLLDPQDPTQSSNTRTQKAPRPAPKKSNKVLDNRLYNAAEITWITPTGTYLVTLRSPVGLSRNLADLTRACAHANHHPFGQSLYYFSQGSAPSATPKGSSNLSGSLRLTSSSSSSKQALTRAHTSVLCARRLVLAYAVHVFHLEDRGLPTISKSGTLLACNTVVASASSGS